MARPAKWTFQRRFLIASVVFGLFVVANIALFGWLIYRSLSQREIENVLFEAEKEGKSLAQTISQRAARQPGDPWTAVAALRETQTYIDSVLAKREMIQNVTILDSTGREVFKSRSEAEVNLPRGAESAPTISSAEVPQRVERVTSDIESGPVPIPSQSFADVRIQDITVPIGDMGSLGTLQIGISTVALSRRIEELRRELIRNALVIGAVSVLLLLTSFVYVWLLLRRSQQLEVQAADAERMAYVGTLASGLAHEIRSPLNSLSLNMQMMEEELAEQPSASSSRRLLAITRSEIGRLERLATDFLTYAKPRALELTEIPAVRLFERLRDVLEGEARKRGLQIVVKDRSGGARVRVDPEQLNQLLLNLAQNAIAATEASGRSPSLFLTVERQGAQVVLELVDNGVGMSQDEQKKIFDLFYSNRKGGTGLGLAIVDRIARAHGAELSLRSSPGVGTAVSVALPTADAAEPGTKGALLKSATS